MDPAQLADLDDSILAAQLLVDTFDASSLSDFAARIGHYIPDVERVNWQEAGPVLPASGYVLERNGTLWILGAGDANYGQLLASFLLSEPLDLSDPPSLVMAHAGLHAQTLVELIHDSGGYAGATRTIWAGHSLGGAAAAIAAVAEVATLGSVPNPKIISTGAPKPGNSAFKSAAAAIPTVRWQSEYDPVPLVPFSLGLFSQFGFRFPFTPLVGLAVGYKQLDGGRLIQQEQNTWVEYNADYGNFNLIQIINWFVQGEFGWETAHSLLNYLALLRAVRGANTPSIYPGMLVGASGSNKMGAPITRAFLVRIFGQLQGQGWSFNFFCGSTDYDQCITYGKSIANAMANAMHFDASIIAITASDPLVTGDSQDYNLAIGGQLGNNTSISSSPPNLAALWQLKVGNTHRRELWLHGLTNQIRREILGTRWTGFGIQLAALTAFQGAMLGGSSGGLISTPPGLWTRTLITGGNRLGGILAIAADTAGRAVLTLDTVLPGTPPAPGTLVTLKGRAPLSNLRGTWPIFSTTPPNIVTISAAMPPFYVYQGKGAALFIQAYNYQQPDSMSYDGIFTHKTGSPYGRQRGRAPRRR